MKNNVTNIIEKFEKKISVTQETSIYNERNRLDTKSNILK